MQQTQSQIDHRFKVGNPSGHHTQKHPNGYFLPLLKRYLEKKINYEDPETQKIVNGKVKDAIIWRLILNASQGDNQAIKEILDRLDGKVAQKLINEGMKDTRIVIITNGRHNSEAEAIPTGLPIEQQALPGTC